MGVTAHTQTSWLSGLVNPDNAAIAQGWAGIFQAAFAAVLVFVGIWQIIIYTFTRSDSIIRNRAFVFLKGFDVVPAVRLGEQQPVFWRIAPVWENTGDTPTRDLIFYVNFLPSKGTLPTNFNFPDISETSEIECQRMLLGPKQSIPGHQQDISIDHMDRIKIGKLRVIIYGWAEYRDEFRNTLHRTEFCRELSVEGDPRNIPCRLMFRVWGPFNGAEKNCYRKPPGKRAPVIRPIYISFETPSHDPPPSSEASQ